MPMSCNIDARGKAIRLTYGCIFLLTGIALLFFWAIAAQTIWAWLISIGLIVAGAFAIFEARTGWCIVRAMGFKTSV